MAHRSGGDVAGRSKAGVGARVLVALSLVVSGLTLLAPPSGADGETLDLGDCSASTIQNAIDNTTGAITIRFTANCIGVLMTSPIVIPAGRTIHITNNGFTARLD